MNSRRLLLAGLLCILSMTTFSGEFHSNGRKWKTYSKGTVSQIDENEFLIIDRSPKTGAGIYCKAPAKAGKNYRVTAEMMAVSESRNGVYIQIRYLPSKKIYQQKIILPMDKRFHKYALTGIAPAGTSSLCIYLYAHPGRITFKVRNPEIQLLKNVKFDKTHLLKRPKGLILDRNTTVIVPRDGSFDHLARQIKEAAKLDLKITKEMPDSFGQSCFIVIGNRNNNPAISYLYDRYYCIVDLKYPGKGGHVLRTLLNPAGDKANYILVGGSDKEGTEESAKRLAELIEKHGQTDKMVKLPFTWDIKLSPLYKLPRDIYHADTYDQSDGYGTRYFGWSVLSRYMAMFHATGDEKYARRFLELAFPKTKADIAVIKRDPVAFKTMDDPLGAPYHYNAAMANIFWNMIENHPVFSDEERAKVAEAMFRQFAFWRDTTNGCGIYQFGAPSDRIGNRHTQWAAISLYTVARYLNKVFPDHEFIYACKAAENFFASIYKYYFVEGEGGNLTWFPSGIEPVPFFILLAGQKDKAAGSALKSLFSSLETLCGNTPDGRILQYVPLSLLRRTAYLLNDRAPLEMGRLLGADLSPEKFRLGQSFKPAPGEYSRDSFHKPRRWYFNRPESETEKAEWNAPFPDKDAAFSIASWRENNDGGDFILVDGHLDKILRQPLHSMALFTLTLNRMPLLAGYRNQLWARKDGLALSKMPTSAHLDNFMSLGNTAGFSSSLPISPTAKWNRAFLRRPGFCLLSDRISETSKKKQTYDLDINWEHGPGLKQNSAAEPGQVRLQDTSVTQTACDYYIGARNNYYTLPAGIETVILRSGVKALLFKGQKKGQRLVIKFANEKKIQGYGHIRLYAYKDRGSCNIYIDDKLLKKAVKHHSLEPELIDLDLGKVSISPGNHELILESETPSLTDHNRFSIGFIALLLSNKPFKFPEGSLSFCDPVVPQFETRKGNMQDKLTGKLSVYSFPAQVSAKTPKTFFTLLSVHPADKVLCRRINDNSVLLKLPEPAVAVRGKFRKMKLDGELLLASEHFLSGIKIKQAGKIFSSLHPVNIDWNLDTGNLQIESDRNTTITVFDKVYRLKKGRSHLSAKNDPKYLAEYRAELKNIKLKASNRKITKVQFSGIELKPQKIVKLGAFPAALLIFKDKIAAAAGNEIKIFDSGLNQINCFKADSIVGKLHYLNKNRQLLAGCMDEKVIAFDAANGKRKWEFISQMADGLKETGAVWYFKSAHPGIYGLSSGKFINGREQIFVGSASTVEILDLNGKLIKREKILWGPVCNFALFPVNGKVTLAMSQLYPGSDYLTCFTTGFKRSIGFNMPPPGAQHFASWAGLNRTGIDAIDLDNDNSMKVISGINGLWNRIIAWDTNGKPLREVSFGPGYSIKVASYGKQRLERRFLSDVKVLRRKDGNKIIAAIIDSIIMFGKQLKKVWRQRLPSPPLITAVSKTTIAVGCKDGTLLLLDFSGKVSACYKTNASWVEMQFLNGTLIAANAAGELYSFDLKQIKE